MSISSCRLIRWPLNLAARGKRGLGCLLWVVALTSFFPARVWADAGLDEYNLAVGLYKQSRWETAAQRFRAFTKTYDKHEKMPLARLYLGLTLVNLEDYKAARDEFRTFVKDYPQNTNVPQARYRVAECSYLMEDFAAARVELENYLKDFPKDTFHDHALPYLADAQLRSNDPSAALINFQQAIDRFPEGPLVDDARFGRARALEALKKDDEAIAQYKELIARPAGPRAADSQFHLAALAFERKRFPEAAVAYTELVTKFPNSRFVPASQLNAGYAYFQSGKFAEAATQFEAAAAEKSQRVTAGYWQGLSLKSQSQYAKAAEVLKATAAIAGEQPLSESILFQQALCERHLGHVADARQLFETVLNKWAKGEFADDCVHALAEQSIEAGDVPTADRLLARFATEFPSSGLRLHVELLSGRLELARAAIGLRDQKPPAEVAAHYDAAAKRFENVMTNSTIPLTRNQARYYLAFSRQLQGKSTTALELLTPLIELVRTEGTKSELVDALVLQADSLLAEKKYDEAEKSAQEYLTLVAKGRQSARAVSVLAVSAAHRKDAAKVDAAVERLKQEFPEHPLRAVTLQQLAELADTSEDWPAAARYYEALIPLWNGLDSQPFAIRGLAWAQLKQKLPESAKTYARIEQQFPNHRLVPESIYYRADALKEAGQVDEAIMSFAALLRKVPGDKPAEPGAELQPPLLYSYRAGLQSARLYRKAKRIKEADAEYEELVKRFPKPQRLDQLLNEWALLNYDAGQYERADVVFRKIVAETPDSELADNARLSLAESDLIAEKFDDARKAFEQLLASEKSDAEVKERSVYQLLVLAVEQQRWADVIPLANKLVADYPNSPQRWYATYSIAEAILANVKATELELEVAREKVTALRKEQDNPELKSQVWFDRVWVLSAEISFRQKKYDEIEATVAELRQRPAKSPFLYQAEEVLGRGYKQQAPPRFEDARKAFERVLADPVADKTETAAKSQFLIGETLFLQEKWADAFLAYQRVFANYKFPEWQAAALLQSGKCDEQQQQWKEAAATYRLLLEKFPNSTHAPDARQRLEVVTKKI